METWRLWRMWWSGLFALAAFVHLLRALANVPVAIGMVAIPRWVSWVVVPVAGLMSGWLMRIALKRREQVSSHRPPTMAAGDLHLKSMGKEEPRHAGQTYCEIQVGATEWGDDWPE